MPNYEYNCSACCHEFSAIKRISERNQPTPCERCGETARRVLAGFAVGGQHGKGTRGYVPRTPPSSGGG